MFKILCILGFIWSIQESIAGNYNNINITFNDLVNQYEISIEKYKQSTDLNKKQVLLYQIKQYAWQLFMLPNNNTLIEINRNINNLCDELDKTRNKKNSKILSKFLKAGIRLFNDFIQDNNTLDYLILLCPDMIPVIAQEFNIIVSIGFVLIQNPVNIQLVTNIIDQFVLSSDEGTHLLSTVFTLAMQYNIGFKEILKNKDISNKQICKYLPWHFN